MIMTREIPTSLFREVEATISEHTEDIDPKLTSQEKAKIFAENQKMRIFRSVNSNKETDGYETIDIYMIMPYEIFKTRQGLLSILGLSKNYLRCFPKKDLLLHFRLWAEFKEGEETCLLDFKYGIFDFRLCRLRNEISYAYLVHGRGLSADGLFLADRMKDLLTLLKQDV